MNKNLKINRIGRTAARRFLAVFLILLLFVSVSGCSVMSFIVPKSVKINSETYKTGFYGDLWPCNLSFKDEEYEIGGKTFRRLDFGEFDCFRAKIGSKSEGTVYCLDSQWEDAKAYYENEENFTYYCELNAKYSVRDHEYYPIEDMDSEKFDELMHIGRTFVYNPFDPVEKRAGELKQTIINADEHEISTIFRFYKESNDGYFCSYKGYYFFLCEGKMYLLRARYMKDNTYGAIEIDEEIAAPFIETAEKFINS